jgi:hypothetical protein
MGAKIKSLPANAPYCFRIHGQIYQLVLPLYPNKANKPGYGLHIFDSAEAEIKRTDNQSRVYSRNNATNE